MAERNERPGKAKSAKHAPFTSVVPIDAMTGEDESDLALLREMEKDAIGFLESFDWCVSVVDVYFGDGVGGVVAVFLFQILPSKPIVDEWLWVVVGDLPPAYFVAEDIKSPHDALGAYIWHRSKWTEAILAGRQPANDVMPVDADPTVELAQALSNRLKLLSDNVLPTFRT